MKTSATVPLRRLAAYFLRLGATGFGGPAALAGAMRRDLVERRGWIGADEYQLGLALAAACPGPLAYQLAVYCGHVRHGVRGALAVAAAFPFAPFLIVVAVASAYGRFGDAGPLRGIFYGVAPVVVVLIVKACWRLAGATLGGHGLARVLAVATGAVTVVLEQEPTLMILAGGCVGLLAFARVPEPAVPAPSTPVLKPPRAALALLLPVAGGGIVLQLFAFFFKTGCLAFGSGLVVVPFLRASVVDQFGWLDERQFLDAVAVGMVSPGPVVITATFVGQVVAGLPGAVAATVGIFAPAVLFTLVAAPLIAGHVGSPRLWGFIRGVTAAVVGVLAGTAVLVGRSSIADPVTAAIASAALLALLRWRRLPEPVLVGSGAIVGIVSHALGTP